MTHIDSEVLPNKTIKGGKISYVGQVFFDQSLIDAVTTVSPYKENKSPRFKNKNDDIMATSTLGKVDNVVEYVLLGNSLEDGIFGWMSLGIDTTKDRTVNFASTCGSDGCTAGKNNMMGKMGKFKGKGGGFPFPDFGKVGGMPPGFGPGGPGGPPGMPKVPKGGIPGYESLPKQGVPKGYDERRNDA
jgi:hypothetical protein